VAGPSPTTTTRPTTTTAGKPSPAWPGPLSSQPTDGRLWEGRTTTGQYWQIQLYDPAPASASQPGIYVADPDIAVVPIDGSTAPATIHLPGDQFDEAWLTDGRIVILDATGLWVAQPDGSGLRQAYRGNLTRGRLVASPDGHHVAVTQWTTARRRSSTPR
jgi:hypothetical protein